MNTEINPYASPASSQITPEVTHWTTIYRAGRLLMVRDGAVLPDVCVVSNQPTGPGDWRKRVRLSWISPWLYLALLANLLVFLILSIVLRKSGWVTYSLSRRARMTVIRKKAAAGIMFVMSIGLIVTAVTGSVSDDLVLTSVLGGLVMLIAALLILSRADAVRVARTKDGWFLVKGCGREFLDTFPERPPGI
ncbi:MAG: hypothetical protein J0M04_12490 [Verrucomicrobia bacterium]|nr:hypothetical protein [Verrucomicrobiota bacterium]